MLRFRSTAKWFVYIRIHVCVCVCVCILFLVPSFVVYYKILNTVPCAIQ